MAKMLLIAGVLLVVLGFFIPYFLPKSDEVTKHAYIIIGIGILVSIGYFIFPWISSKLLHYDE